MSKGIRRPHEAVDFDVLTSMYPPPPEYLETAYLADPETIERVQLARLQDRAARAYGVPFFRRRWDAAGFAPGDLRSLDDLWQAPAYTVDDIRTLSDNIDTQMERLSRLTDLIYIHIDLDVLDPPEVMGHPLTVPNGPTNAELAVALEMMFRYAKAAALGLASYPATADPDKTTLRAVYRFAVGAIKGLQGL